jgi:hypothetical protein
VVFTILTNDGQALIVSQALNLLKTAVLDNAAGAAAAPRAMPSGSTSAVESRVTPTIRMNRYYICEGERVAVFRCGGESDDAICSVQYPDRKSAATGGLTPSLPSDAARSLTNWRNARANCKELEAMNIISKISH